jgi:hypothetical protein
MDGALLCTIEVPARRVAIDEQGFIVIGSNNPYTISKYSP